MSNQQIQKQNRKLQISGRCSYIVSIPKRWVTDMGLTRGSSVSITWHNSTSLLVTATRPPDSSPAGKKMTIVTVPESEQPATTALKIANLYVSGRNSVQLRFSSRIDNVEKRSRISNLVRNQLIGAEIISDSQENLLVEFLLGNSELTIENAIKRLSSVSSLMLEESIDAFRTSNVNLAKSTIENFEAERFSYYVQRNILGSLGHTVFKDGDVSEPDELGILLLISRALLDSANCAKEIARQVASAGSPSCEFEEAVAINELKELVMKAYHSAVLSYFKQDARAAEETLEMTRLFKSRIENQVRGSMARKTTWDSGWVFSFVSMLASLKKVSELSSEIAELVLELVQKNTVEESVDRVFSQLPPLTVSISKRD
jgi:phosphate uptake regulator